MYLSAAALSAWVASSSSSLPTGFPDVDILTYFDHLIWKWVCFSLHRIIGTQVVFLRMLNKIKGTTYIFEPFVMSPLTLGVGEGKFMTFINWHETCSMGSVWAAGKWLLAWWDMADRFLIRQYWCYFKQIDLLPSNPAARQTQADSAANGSGSI